MQTFIRWLAKGGISGIPPRHVLLGKLVAFDGQAFVVRHRRDTHRLLDTIVPRSGTGQRKRAC